MAQSPAAKPASAERPLVEPVARPSQPPRDSAPIVPPPPPAIIAESTPAGPPPKEAAAALRPSLPPIDEDRVAAQGIRKLESERLTLYTDLPLDDEINSLPEQFDQAYPQWRENLGLADQEAKPWHVVGRLMNDEAKFRAAGLLPDELPQFQFGYTRGDEIWWREQPSTYYRRHLMLHEGTHSFMYAHFGTCGPPWYMEGMAELLGTHSLVEGVVKLDVFPDSRDDVPYWGRVKIVREAVRDGQSLSLEQVLALEPGVKSTVVPYGWCWAMAAFLDGHPRYRDRFRKLPAELRHADFDARMKAAYENDWPSLNEEWQCFTADLEYGYDFERNAIDFVPGEPLSASNARIELAADRGWQSTGIRLEAGKTYRLNASGRYQIGAEPRIWWCEPNGVTIRYHAGRPLGVLLAAIHPDPYDPAAMSSLLSPIEVGLGAELTPAETGTLYLRINDSPAELGDNAGSLQVQVTAE